MRITVVVASLVLALLVSACAPFQPPVIASGTPGVVQVPVLPTLPATAKLIFARPVLCPGGVGEAKGYDTNANGDYDIMELWREGVRLVVVYFDAATEQQATRLFVQEGAKVLQYTLDAALARFPDICAFYSLPQEV